MTKAGFIVHAFTNKRKGKVLYFSDEEEVSDDDEKRIGVSAEEAKLVVQNLPASPLVLVVQSIDASPSFEEEDEAYARNHNSWTATLMKQSRGSDLGEIPPYVG